MCVCVCVCVCMCKGVCALFCATVCFTTIVMSHVFFLLQIVVDGTYRIQAGGGAGGMGQVSLTLDTHNTHTLTHSLTHFYPIYQGFSSLFGTGQGGLSYQVYGMFNLKVGDELNIVVGQSGNARPQNLSIASSTLGGGGGGGTFGV